MFVVYRGYALNLDQYHRFFLAPDNPLRIYFDIRAGGKQEDNGREIFEFETEEDRDEAFDLISGALAMDATCFDLDGHWAEMAQALVDQGGINKDGVVTIICCRCEHAHQRPYQGLTAFNCDGCGHAMCKICWENADLAHLIPGREGA